jgi:hypothetical protein
MFGKYNGFVCKARVSACMYFPVNSIPFIWNDNMREKREANANAT